MIRKKKNKKVTAAILIKRTEKVRIKKVGGESVASMPAAVWEDIEDFLEELAMSQSPRYLTAIKKARKEIADGESYTLEEVRAKLLKKRK